MPVSYRTSYAIHRVSGKGDSPAVARWRQRRLHGIGLGYVHRENQGAEKGGAQGEESGEDRVSQGQIAGLRAHLPNTPTARLFSTYLPEAYSPNLVEYDLLGSSLIWGMHRAFYDSIMFRAERNRGVDHGVYPSC